MNRAKLLERFKNGNALLESTLVELHAAYPEEVGTLERWSVKDTLAHIVAWQTRWVDWLGPVAQGKPLDENGPRHLNYSDAEENERNAQIFEEYKGRSWDDVLAESRRVYARFLELVPLMSEDDFANPQRFAWSSGRPFWRRMTGTFYWHPQGHVMEACLARGETERGMQVASSFAHQARDDETTEEQAGALYNLACFYARVGKSREAIATLKPAFLLNPDLMDWCKQDHDLDSLRDLPEFRELCTQTAREEG